MPIAALKQEHAFEIDDWEPDAEFAVFPQGARAKDAVFAPAVPASALVVPGKRYLFKRSKLSYPDQFWAEVVAYRIGCLMGVQVPPAFAANHSNRALSGALIEWFYDPNELWVPGGDFLQQIRPDYDRRVGRMHNLQDITKVMRALDASPKMKISGDWKRWWVEALIFDALIGNTDRHQDNWGLVFSRQADGGFSARLGPAFDNGTSLGHERFPERVAGWSEERLTTYVNRGTHHVKWSLEGEVINGHNALVARALQTWRSLHGHAKSLLDFSADDIRAALADLPELEVLTPLSAKRFAFVTRLLVHRLEILKTLIYELA